MTRKSKDQDDTAIEIGSGNVFADLGLPDAEDMQVKARLVYEIGQIVKKRGLTQAGIGRLLGIEQPDVSNLLRGRMRGYSIERLLRSLTALNQDVQITITPAQCQDHEEACGKISVAAL